MYQGLGRNQQKDDEEGIETKKEVGVAILVPAAVGAEVEIAEGEVAVGIVVRGIVKGRLMSNLPIINIWIQLRETKFYFICLVKIVNEIMREQETTGERLHLTALLWSAICLFMCLKTK